MAQRRFIAVRKCLAQGGASACKAWDLIEHYAGHVHDGAEAEEPVSSSRVCGPIALLFRTLAMLSVVMDHAGFVDAHDMRIRIVHSPWQEFTAFIRRTSIKFRN